MSSINRFDEFQAALDRKFSSAAAWNPLNRRDFLRLMGASLALGGLVACTRQPDEKIVPFVNSPENQLPGQPLWYATAVPLDGYGMGVLAESHAGRPTKIEGNPLHPASLGGADGFAQASILDLYDPDRARTVRHEGQDSSWEALAEAMEQQLAQHSSNEGQGIRLLTGPVTSPTLLQLIREFLETYPQAVWHVYTPVNRDFLHEATTLAFGAAVDPVYAIAKAEVIVAFDADFLGVGPGRVRYARDFASRRRVEQGALNRLYVLESTVSITGIAADHRLALRPDQIEQFARALARELGVAVQGESVGVDTAWIQAVAADLREQRGRSLVLAGEQRSPALQALAFAINHALGNLGATVSFIPPVAGQAASLRELTTAMESGAVEMLVLLETNPVYSAPADLRFAEHLRNVPLVVQHGLLADETAALAHWSVPGAHYLEAWGDVRAFDGTLSIIQPLIKPLYAGKSAIDMLLLLLGRSTDDPYEVLKEFWETTYAIDESAWNRVIHDGVQVDSRSAAAPVGWSWRDVGLGEIVVEAGALDVAIAPDPSVWDGTFANNAWLQELPRPVTTLTWDNALQISEETAGQWGLTTGDGVELASAAGTVVAPVLVTVGIPRGGGVITLGYGRTAAGRVGNGVGFRAATVQSADSPWHAAMKLRKIRSGYRFALTQPHRTLAGRHPLRVGTVAEFRNNPGFVEQYEIFGRQRLMPSMHPPHDYSQRPQWGMVIDLSACIGCNVCTLACQAENNIPVVGKREVGNGRAMHWIRVDRYHENNAANGVIHHQPLTCMHCEVAPCEAVCPVNATVHSTDGINQMVYNQCIGSRYCANNCPYKVRRFNFYQYADHETPSLKLQRNPNVTVRVRGVMEKCTFCIQRISAARIEARRQNRPLVDREVLTACQQACPTQAIVFGDLLDPASEVARAKASPLNYGVLQELSTQPRVTYLARIRNPNPVLETAPVMNAPSHAV